MSTDNATCNSAPWDKLDKDFLRETHKDRDWSMEAIAEKLGRSEKAIIQMAGKMGLRRPVRTKINHARVKRMVMKGIGVNEIARELGCHGSTINRAKRKLVLAGELPPEKGNG